MIKRDIEKKFRDLQDVNGALARENSSLKEQIEALQVIINDLNASISLAIKATNADLESLEERVAALESPSE